MSEEQHHYDLVIVGGGPAGSSAAFAAAKKGVKVALLEKEKKDVLQPKPILDVPKPPEVTSKPLQYAPLVSHEDKEFEFKIGRERSRMDC